jgi:hypothetical protein
VSAVAQEQEDIHLQIDKCQAQIYQHQELIKDLDDELQSVDAKLTEFADERKKYELLTTIRENLEQLEEIGAGSLFWAGIVEEDHVEGQLKQLRDKASFFERRIRKVVDKREYLVNKIQERNIEIEYLLEEIEILREREEENQNGYVIEREVKALPYRPVVMPWTKKNEDEKKYRKVLFLTLLICILLGLLIPQFQLPVPDRMEVIEIPERLAKVIKKQELPKPKPKPPKPEEKKPEEPKKTQEKEKKPTPEQRKEARKKVQNKGVLAFRNNLADLLEDTPEAKLGASASLSNKGSIAKNVKRNILTTQASNGSGGISTSSLSRDVAGTGKKIAAVAFSHVESGIGAAAAEDRPLSDGPGPSRTDEEIQIVFDKYKAALYRIYNRELRTNPTLQGKMVLRITIEPDGSVSLCKVESTDLESKTLVSKIVDRVKKFNFGDKPGVPTITILYPIDFLPAS